MTWIIVFLCVFFICVFGGYTILASTPARFRNFKKDLFNISWISALISFVITMLGLGVVTLIGGLM